MTGRQLIEAICESTQDLDAHIPVSIVYRDEFNCVVESQKVNAFTYINGKLRIEGNRLGEREPYR